MRDADQANTFERQLIGAVAIPLAIANEVSMTLLLWLRLSQESLPWMMHLLVRAALLRRQVFRLGGRISRIFWVWATVTETTLAFLWAKKRECLFWDVARRAIDNWEWHVDSSPLRKIRRSQSLWWNSTRSCMKSCWPNLEFPHCPNRERSRQRTNQLLHAIEPINRSRIKQCKMIQLPNV